MTKNYRRSILAAAVAHALSIGTAQANPTGATVVRGLASINATGKALTITTAPGSIINWQSFSIGAGELTRFQQSSSLSAVLNRVVGRDPSAILGALQSNGRVFLVNPHGIVFGAGSRIDTVGLVASTLNISDRDFLEGRLRFEGGGNGVLRNEGAIHASGDIFLVGPRIENAGLISSDAGSVLLAAGKAVTITSPDAQGVQFALQAPADTVLNLGTIEAKGAAAMFAGTLRHSGEIHATRVVLSAKGDAILEGNAVISADSAAGRGGRVEAASARATGGSVDIVAASAVLDFGSIRADGGGSVTLKADRILQAGAISAKGGGNITLEAQTGVIQTESALLDVSSAGGAGGTISADAGAGRLFSSAIMDATGITGGTVRLSGREIFLLHGQLDTSGRRNGGTILIGGDAHGTPISGAGEGDAAIPNALATYVNSTTTFRADGGIPLSPAESGAGNGGRIIVWSDENTKYFGGLSARGGTLAGNGGFAEVSGRNNLVFGGQADLSARNGVNGTLLLDPANITIGAPASYSAFQLLDPYPAAGNRFGQTVTVLPNDNVVVTAPGDSFAAVSAGAVYLFNGTTGALASALTGSTANDQVGSGGTVVLTNGNYVVPSSNWGNGVATPAVGAVTWGSGTVGVSGLVSAANSLIGSTTGDQSYGPIVPLTNGNYVVGRHWWNSSMGAATWVDGTTGRVVDYAANGNRSIISAANSLVGSIAGDFVGGDITALANGNYVVNSSQWGFNLGATTWGNGLGGTIGTVSLANSLVGTINGERVGAYGVAALNNGNYVVRSPNWGSGTWGNGRGAATWVDGSTGRVSDYAANGNQNIISAANSVVGSIAGDFVGAGVVALANGNYVVGSYLWNNGLGSATWSDRRGAATWVDGTTGRVSDYAANGNQNIVSAANSLVGSNPKDWVGSRINALTNGNYVVSSPQWASGATAYVGAVTWGDGSTAGTRLVGPVSAANSLVGTTYLDQVGSGGVTALSNGNYVVKSPNWKNGAVTKAGAATWGDGSTAGTRLVGVVSAANSLVGSTTNDQVGYAVTALTNGHYVVQSPMWDNGPATDAGAVTWGNGTGGTVDTVSSANSLVGTAANDQVGGYGGDVFALANGNYVALSKWWSGYGNAGAVTWGDGSTAGTRLAGAVSAANSLVGAPGDKLGWGGITLLPGSNYVVSSPNWNSSTGAVAWGDGSTAGTRLAGTVSVANSSLGSNVNDNLGSGGVSALSSGNYVVGSPLFADGGAANAGRVDVLPTSPQVPSPAPWGYADYPGQSVTVTPASITAITNTGTAVTLQASNDITVNAAISTLNGALHDANIGGAINLHAGRSILVNASITTDDGNLSMVANDTVAHGVVAADRAAGTAQITLNSASTINLGIGTLTLDAQGGNMNFNGNVNVGAFTLNGGTLANLGTFTSSGTVTLGGGTALTNSGTYNWTSGMLNGTGTFSNGGALGMTGAGARALNGPVINSGALTVFSGSLDVQAGALNTTGLLTISSGATLTATGGSVSSSVPITLAGTLRTGAGTVSAPGLTITPTGLLTGNGTVTGNVTNNGTVAPGNSAGTLTISGTYAQGAGGTLDIELDGTAAGQYDVLAVSGTATLNGTVNFSGAATSGSFPFLTASSVSGTFAGQTGTLNPTLAYNAGNVTATLWVPPSSAAGAADSVRAAAQALPANDARALSDQFFAAVNGGSQSEEDRKKGAALVCK